MVIKMKSLIAGLALVVASNVNAEEPQKLNLPVICGSAEQFAEVVDKAQETQKFLGESINQNGTPLYTFVFGNQETGTWTVGLYNREMQTVCMVGYGKGYSVFPDGQRF